MEAITAEMQKHFKITARKKLYFALAVMFKESRNTVKFYADAAQKLHELSKQDGSPEELKKAAVLAIGPLVSSVRPVFCLVAALKEYRSAMGEYPEFSKFLTKKEDELDGAITKTMEIISATQGLLDVFATKGNPAPRLRESAFGEDFIEACESIKIRGE